MILQFYNFQFPAGRAPVKAEESKSAGKKLSYKLQRELDMLPDQIAAAEAERDALAAKAGEPDFYSGDADAIQKTLEALSAAEAKIEALEERWLELEEMAS